MSNKTKKVFVMLSGGVDSSVAAALIKNLPAGRHGAGFEVIGCHIKCFNIDGCGARDAEDARRVAEKLNIPFYVFDLEQEYKDKVVSYMVDGYKKGLTPNPDIMCNQEIKFGLFLKRAIELGADYVASGHYVKLDRGRLAIAKDKNKDQSYFLWTLTQDQLKHCIFPLGDLNKKEVRKLAKKYDLPTSEKKDSQGICFLGKVTLSDFLKNYIPAKRGLILNAAGQKVGEHDGAYYYTIGQRHGLNLGRITANPHYVSDKNVKTNTITVAEGADNDLLAKKEVKLTNLNFTPKKETAVLARVRYRQPLQRAILSGSRLVFDEPQKFIAPGQSAVFYDTNGILLGGGVIK